MICDLKWPRTGPVVLLSLEAGGLSLLMAALYLPTISFLGKDSIPPGLSCWNRLSPFSYYSSLLVARLLCY